MRVPGARRVIRRMRGGPVQIPRTTTQAPIFVGGTGRSGTTVTARILGEHPSLYDFPKEAKFVTVQGGLCDLAAGRTRMRRFRSRMLGDWADRAVSQGVEGVIDRALIEAAIDQLDEDSAVDPWAAGAAFTHRLLDPVAGAAGADGWVEMTPGNALAARELLRMFPDMRLIHSMRDGRDVACSIVGKAWGPDDLDEALDYWGGRLRTALAATAAVPADQVLALQMESLITGDRDGEYGRILAFLGLTDAPEMRAYFADRVTEGRAHLGRWRTDVPPERLAAFEARYQRIEADIAADIEAMGADRSRHIMHGKPEARPGAGATVEGSS